MIRRLVADHLFPYMLLLAVIGIMLGVLGTYLISGILAILEIAKFTFSALSLGGGA